MNKDLHIVHPLFHSSPISGVDIWQAPLLLDPQYLDPSSHTPIGKQAELAMLRSLEQNPKYEVLAHGLQVAIDGITIGEFDFIVMDLERSIPLHIEMVCKYYVSRHSRDAIGLADWVGPKGKDSLVLKLEKLQSHQFPLIRHEAALPLLRDLGVATDEIEQRLAFFAELYTRGGRVYDNESADVLTNDGHTGEYLAHGEQLPLSKESTYHLCERNEWLSAPILDTSWHTSDDIRPLIDSQIASGRAVMLWKKSKNEGMTKVLKGLVP